MPRPKPEWSEEQLQTFETLWLEGEDVREIANELAVCVDRVKKLAFSMPMEKKDLRLSIVMKASRITKKVASHNRREPSNSAWADRDSRYDTPRSLTGEFFGDPRPGQSALDKRLVA